MSDTLNNSETVEKQIIETTPEDKPTEAVKQTGRASYLSKYKERYPDATDDTPDDTLYEDALGQISSSEEKYNELAGANKRLSELVSADPKLAAALTMIAQGKSLPYAVSKLYGRDFLELDDQGRKDFEEGYQEYLQKVSSDQKSLDEAIRNIEDYNSKLETFGKKNGLGEEDIDKLGGAVETFVMDALHGKIGEEFIDFVYKGMNYDQDIADAAASGEAEGKNKVIEPRMRNMSEQPVAPGRSIAAPPVKRASSPKRFEGSHWDNLEDIK